MEQRVASAERWANQPAVRETVARLYVDVAKIPKDPEIRRRILELGADPGGMPPEELTTLMKSDIPRLGKIVRDSGATVD